MKVTVKSNVTFKKLKKANLEEMVFNSLIRPLGKAAKKKIDNAFKNSTDINEKPYPPYTAKYRRAKEKAGKGSEPQMVFHGDLKRSISKVLTNKKDMTVTIKSDESKLGRSNPYGKPRANYGALHLTGQTRSNRQTPKIRKWFFTEDEIQDNKILLDSNLLGNDFDKAMSAFSKKLESQLKTRMRIIGSKKMPASSNFARTVKI
jgi:hypothetical protein